MRSRSGDVWKYLPMRLDWEPRERRYVGRPSHTVAEQRATHRKKVLWTDAGGKPQFELSWQVRDPIFRLRWGSWVKWLPQLADAQRRADERAQMVFEVADRIKVYRPDFQGAFSIASAILQDKLMRKKDGAIDLDAVTGCIAAMVDIGRQSTAPLVRIIVYSKDVRRDLALDGLAMALGKEEAQSYLKRRARLEPDEAIKATLLWAVDALDGPPLPVPVAEPAPLAELPAEPALIERFEQVEVRATENQEQPHVTKIRLQKGAYFVLEPYPQDSWTGGGSKTGVYCNFMGYADRGHKWMRLNYQIGSQVPVPVVAGLKYRVESTGILKLFCNDGRTVRNKGMIRVLIKVSQ
jgi:hypothetical protein